MLFLVVLVLSVGVILFFVAVRPSPERRHADETVIPGYEQIYERRVDENGIETVYAGPRDEHVTERISAPGLDIYWIREVEGPPRYNWVAHGEFDGDDCRVFVKRIDTDSEAGRPYLDDVSELGKEGPVDVISLIYVCGKKDT
ncbi:hypothetical protein [Nocardia carnea]|uniref:hypothetical protein n=1 Tax=Nocardia carnea TaxID=37328 RepID=UPI002456BFDB|nr:hypothetical protein [Nocardia carnea]